MALLNFPENPVDGQLYPVPCPAGVTQYRWDLTSGIWRIVGVATGVAPATYGSPTIVGKFTVNSAGVLTDAENVPIQSATTTQPGLVQLTNSTSSIDEQKALTARGGKALQDQIGNLSTCIVPDHVNVVAALNDLQLQTTILQTNSLIWCGYYNAEEGDISYVSISGQRLGYEIGQELPTPSAKNGGDFFIVTKAGNPYMGGDYNAPDMFIDVGNWILSEGTRWSEVDAKGGDILASQVKFVPTKPLTATNVQNAITQVVQLLNTGGVGGATVSTVPPSEPYVGQLWWDCESGYFYIYYRDIDGDQWVEVGGGGSELVLGGGGGTVSEIKTGVGLTGGPITSQGTISLLAATPTTIGGVIPGRGTDYDQPTGTLSVDLTANYGGADPNKAFSQAGANALAAQIAALSGSNVLAGTYDARAGVVAYATPAGQAKGFVTGEPLPPAVRALDNYYVIVTIGGPVGPDGYQPSNAGDWWIVQGDPNTLPSWILIDFENYTVAADNVTVRTIPGVGFVNNVQIGLETVERQVQDRIQYAQALTDGIQLKVSPPDTTLSTGTRLTASLNYATLSQRGIVQLTDNINGSSNDLAVTQAAVSALSSKIDALGGATVLAGTYNSNTGVMVSVTAAGLSNGFSVGLQTPPASAVRNGYYVIVTVPGGFGPPDAKVPAGGFKAGDWVIASNRAPYDPSWVTVSYNTVSTSADLISVSPIPNLSATNVQDALLQLENQIDTSVSTVVSANPGILSYTTGAPSTSGEQVTLALQPAASTHIGGVSVSPGSGLSVSTSGALTTSIATADTTGTIKVGDGLSISASGVLSVVFPSLVSSITAGEGLMMSSPTGTGNVSLSVRPPQKLDNIKYRFDGVRKTFRLYVDGNTVAPANSSAVLIVLNGLVQTAGDAYTVSGSNITFTTAPSTNTEFYGVLFP